MNIPFPDYALHERDGKFLSLSITLFLRRRINDSNISIFQIKTGEIFYNLILPTNDLM
jgi:hypothetical protein